VFNTLRNTYDRGGVTTLQNPEISRNLLRINSVHTAMKTNYVLALAALAVLSPLTGLAQDPDHSWSRTYPVTGKPTLTLETSDAGVEFHPCGDCHEIRIHVGDLFGTDGISPNASEAV
jgi:hypothetical protein